MVDVGTTPLPSSISKLTWLLEFDESIGGACGEIMIDLTPSPPGMSRIDALCRYSVLCTQFVEYRIGHDLDKSLETVFGYVSVLPGAFAVYRWEAIRNSPLDLFLVGLRDDLTCHELNLYLAEDRIMGFGIVCNTEKAYRLKYLADCIAVTDGPETIAGVIK